MRILFVTSEAFPLIKTGGLADVSGSLPAALQQIGVDVRILMPGYPAVLNKLVDVKSIGHVHYLPVIGTAELLLGNMPDTGVPVMAVKAPSLYDREGGPYIDAYGRDWHDNALRFGVLSKVAAILSSSSTSAIQDWLPDIVHCNDWQTGLTPAYIHFAKMNTGMKYAKSVISIHNLAFQGNYAEGWRATLDLPPESYQMEGLEYYNQLSFLKAGIFYADSISTVSQTYAHEIQTPEFGFGMQGLLTTRSHEIVGILNGIDLNEWNPANDPHFKRPIHNALAKKQRQNQTSATTIFGAGSKSK